VLFALADMTRPSRVLLFLALGGCGVGIGGEDDLLGTEEANVQVAAAAAIPATGDCTHIIATRLADFQVTEYRGLLADASLAVRAGEHRVTATAYPQPCGTEPPAAPWRAVAQTVTFVTGDNLLKLNFRADASVGIDPTFGDATPVIRGSRVRIGRNGEDAAGPDYALDGWEVKRIGVPPVGGGGGTPAETVVFSTQGKGNLGYSPRGMAATTTGRFVFQLAEVFEPLRVFDGAGNFVESLPIVYPNGRLIWDNTDGLDAIDPTHFVRTGWINADVGCDASGDNCTHAGLDILERKVGAGGAPFVEVTKQILLPSLPNAPLNEEYPVGVAYVNGRYAVTTLPEGFSRLVLVNDQGAVVAGPTRIDGTGAEGVYSIGDGRIGVLEYEGRLTTYDGTTAAVRPGEERRYTDGAGLSNPTSVTWSDAAGGYIALAGKRLVVSTPSFDAVTNLAIDLSAYAAPSGVEYRPDTNQLLVVDRLPPFAPGSTTVRQPAVDFFSLQTSTKDLTVALQGVPMPVRARTLAWVTSRQQIVSHYRRPGTTADSSLDPVAFVHNLDGTLARKIDLTAFGVLRIGGVNYLRGSDELLFVVVDTSNVTRLMVTDLAGTPRRSMRTTGLDGFVELAPIATGVNAGDVGVIFGQPSEYARIAQP